MSNAPAPWKVEEYVSPAGHYFVTDADGGLVARMGRRPSAKRDAKLIAAAPELVAMLRTLVRRRREKARTPQEADGSDGRYARARELIARITGEQA